MPCACNSDFGWPGSSLDPSCLCFKLPLSKKVKSVFKCLLQEALAHSSPSILPFFTLCSHRSIMLQRAIQQPGLKQGPSQRLQGATHGYNAHRSTIGRLHRKLTTTAVTQAEVSSPEPAQEQRDAWNSFATNVSGGFHPFEQSKPPQSSPLPRTRLQPWVWE